MSISNIFVKIIFLIFFLRMIYYILIPVNVKNIKILNYRDDSVVF